MTFDDLIRFKTLQLKYVSSGAGLVDAFIGKTENMVPMKNVCAMIAQTLFDDLTEKCALLDISKRAFIEAAIIEALAKAENIMQAEGLHEYLAGHSQTSEKA